MLFTSRILDGKHYGNDGSRHNNLGLLEASVLIHTIQQIQLFLQMQLLLIYFVTGLPLILCFFCKSVAHPANISNFNCSFSAFILRKQLHS